MFKLALVGLGTLGFITACNACPLVPLVLGVCTFGAASVAVKQ